jgi:hypothetical protein
MRFVALAVLALQNSSLALVMNIATQKKFFKVRYYPRLFIVTDKIIFRRPRTSGARS